MTNPASSGDEPPQLSVQDFIFRAGGALPPARLSQRFISFVLDALLIGALAVFVVFRIILPSAYPVELGWFQDWFVEYQQAQGHGAESVPGIESFPPEVWRMLVVAQNLIMVFFWIYFAATDTFFQGKTLGKRTFRLKVVHRITLGPPDLPSAFIRATIKTLCLFTLFPFALLAFTSVFFLKHRRAAHDVLSKTIVVEDNTPPAPPSIDGG